MNPMNPMERLESLLVSDVMSREVTTIEACKDMDAAAATLHENWISTAPVVDEAGRTVGILSAADFLRRDIPHYQGALEVGVLLS